MPIETIKDTAIDQLKMLVDQGIKDCFGNCYSESLQIRIDDELSDIIELNLAESILMAKEVIETIRLAGIFTPGLRQNSNCLFINYCLGITIVNPMAYNLPFERYLGLSRRSRPLFGVDLRNGQEKRVLACLTEKYGEGYVVTSGYNGNFDYVISIRKIDTEEIFELGILECDFTLASENPKSLEILRSEEHFEKLCKTSGFSVLLGEDIFSPKSFDDLVNRLAINSRKEAGESDDTVEFFKSEVYGLNPVIDNILSYTDGKIMYQEQVMRLLHEIGGFSYFQTEELRRFKIWLYKINQSEEAVLMFIEGAKSKGITSNVAKKLYEEITSNFIYTMLRAYFIYEAKLLCLRITR